MDIRIVVANRTQARFFSYDSNKRNEIEYLGKIENPRGRLRNRDINADKPGSYLGNATHRSSWEKKQAPIERVAEDFARQVTDVLELEKENFEGLVMVAPPDFLGQMRSFISRDLSHRVVKEIAKDLGAVSNEEVLSRMWQEPLMVDVPPDEVRP